MAVTRTGDNLPETCPKCHASVRGEFNFCPFCSESLRQICTSCRAALEPNWTFCPICGVGQSDIPDIAERAEMHNNRGTALYENNENEEAIREFEAAITLYPLNAVYHTNLAVALSEAGEYDRAVFEFHESLRLDADNPGAYLQLGYTYQEMEKPLQAVEMWHKVVGVAPESQEAEEAREALASI